MTAPTSVLPLSNERLAECLEEVAELLEVQEADPFRVRAYRSAAGTVRDLPYQVHDLADGERIGTLRTLPGIGRSLARSIDQLTRTGRLGLLERLRGDSAVEDVFMTVPGIGPELARRIHEQLGIESLLELEAVAYDGSLGKVQGMGKRRLDAVRSSLAGRFQQHRWIPESRRRSETLNPPPVAELLDVDREYREAAERGRLPRIAPKRFNPTGAAWLPILHTQRGVRHYTALFSNTARAHELGMTHDWVVIYRDDHDGEGQWTVITAHFGSLRGRRVVRGREGECAACYAPPSASG